MKIKLILTSLLFSSLSLIAQVNNFRAPSYPLVTHDPYFSIWSSDENPTRVEIKLNFLSPVLAEDLDLVSRPLSYLTWSFTSKDKKNHKAEIYFEISGLAALDNKSQPVIWGNQTLQNLEVLKMGSKEQPVLQKSGDDLRIDWGYLYVAVNKSDIQSSFAGNGDDAIIAFTDRKPLPQISDLDQGKRAIDLNPVIVLTIPVNIQSGLPVEKHIMLSYDDIFSVEYFGKKLEGYWKKKFTGIEELLQVADKEYGEIKSRCDKYDQDLLAKAESLGGKEYASICALAYRQCMAAHKVVKDENGQPLCFSKENFSNGSMGTVDVFYPAAPFFLYLNPELIKAQTTPIFDYAESGRWPWP